MKQYHKRIKLIGLMIALIGFVIPLGADAASWMYKKDSDALTDKKYSFAAGFAFDYEYNNDFTVSFQCTEGKVRFEINADTLITSKGKEFSFTYRVDKRKARQIMLRTFSNESQGGYTCDGVTCIAKDILGGNEMFVRVISWNNDYLEATVSLTGSDSAIKKVFADCGMSLDSSTHSQLQSYSLKKFTSDFSKLTPAEQQKMLSELQRLIKK